MLLFFVTDRKDGLKAHIDAVHEKKRPHKCDYCDGAFFLRRDKERHLLKFHNIDVKKGGVNVLITTPSCWCPVSEHFTERHATSISEHFTKKLCNLHFKTRKVEVYKGGQLIITTPSCWCFVHERGRGKSKLPLLSFRTRPQLLLIKF